MDQQQGQTGPQGPAGRRLHIAHRRSPSEMTPLMSMYLTLASLDCQNAWFKFVVRDISC